MCVIYGDNHYVKRWNGIEGDCFSEISTVLTINAGGNNYRAGKPVVRECDVECTA
ncbi:MAG: hypothetical protein DHS20C20_00710 [Ardenticatenaceae bacterium]|nr:MAG: hypothetical protein DHS20C20_00710 [Ardenticatenaceae bacterium]